jgi:hypothetical protein
MVKPTIQTPKGKGQIDSLYISELGFLMLKVYFENGTYTTYNLGKHNPDDNMLTDKIMKYETKEN